ncbi:ARPP-2 domain-containing protein [Nocardiopsis suaedae]|uniref:ARG and Rhodanese-Phosphatase-superfamily-associated domain-containing protein n=1 Tax=Nocardiopsis suaedae TaxID=3018444 RepID=A0ABT4TH10_9ACTN|nr:hypothetical protein [Nocardiopsis suaedae]MDA2803977.1 hypothetical protein [Nocardiopsis suaedae]
MTDLTLKGLETGRAQVRGGVRMVPLLRRRPVEGLRLHPRLTGGDIAVVGSQRRPRYIGYVPHAYVATWGGEAASAAYGTWLSEVERGAPSGAEAERAAREEAAGAPPRIKLFGLRRQVQRTDRTRLRFLPLHLAMEGYLSLHFGGPDIAWKEWSRTTLRRGLSPREEDSYLGVQVRGLAEALRTFEIVRGQCGVALYVGDELASVVVTPHPEDYRALHPTLVLDMFGEAIYRNATFVAESPHLHAPLRTRGVSDLAGLRAALEEQRASWRDFHDETMLAPLTDADYTLTPVYRMGEFRLDRFLPSFDPARTNHIGEAIVREDGEPGYLKTFVLSNAQTKRGHLLSKLAAAGWHLDATAASLATDRRGLITRMRSAGMEHLLRQDILDRFWAGNPNP